MLTEAERAELNHSLKQLGTKSYGDIAKHLTQKLGREITRNTVRYYLGLSSTVGKPPRGRPKGTERKQDAWDRLIPELLALTGLRASCLYRQLRDLIAPRQLPFQESAFHDRTGLRKRLQSAAPKNARTSLLTRCRLRIRVIEGVNVNNQKKRVYLCGYEEFTGYISFDVIANPHPNASQIARFVNDMEQHVALPVRRILATNVELSEADSATHLRNIQVECCGGKMVLVPYSSEMDRKAEIDWLERLTKQQNNDVARNRVVQAKRAIAEFIQSEQSNRTWRRLSARDICRRSLADELKSSLHLRFKLRAPGRRPRY